MSMYLPKWKNSLWLVCVLVVLAGCTKDEVSDTTTEWNPSITKAILNEAYGSGARQRADIYLPANRNANTRLLITLHGGGWTSGDKADLTASIQQLRIADPSLAIANIGYTLADGSAANRHPAQMIDIEAAVDYIRSKQNLWQIGNNISILGVSAGAHLAMLYTYDYDKEKKIKSLVNIVGPSNFADPLYTGNPIFQAVATSYIGSTWLQDPNKHRALSPVNYINKQTPPTLMAYAGQDLLVPPGNATDLRNAFVTAGAVHEYYFYPTDPHELSAASIADILGKTIPFLVRYGK